MRRMDTSAIFALDYVNGGAVVVMMMVLVGTLKLNRDGLVRCGGLSRRDSLVVVVRLVEDV